MFSSPSSSYGNGAFLKLWQSHTKLRLPTLPFALFPDASVKPRFPLKIGSLTNEEGSVICAPLNPGNDGVSVAGGTSSPVEAKAGDESPGPHLNHRGNTRAVWP